MEWDKPRTSLELVRGKPLCQFKNQNWRGGLLISMNFKLKHLILAVFGLALLSATLFIQAESKNKEDLKNINFGFPLAFVAQDHLDKYSFYFFPTWDRFDFHKIKTVKNFRPMSAAADFLIIFSALEILIFLLENATFWLKNKFSGESEGETKIDKNLL